MTPQEPYEVQRRVRDLFDVFPRGTWPWLLPFLAMAAVAIVLLAGCGGGGGARGKSEVEPPPPAQDCPGDVIVAKGCRCRHKIAIRPHDAALPTRNWIVVTFEEWERVQIGECWPPEAPVAAPESRPESRIVWPGLEGAVHEACAQIHESFDRLDAKLADVQARAEENLRSSEAWVRSLEDLAEARRREHEARMARNSALYPLESRPAR